MRSQNIFKFAALCSVVLATTLTTAWGQVSATWIGPSSGGEWNTAANWDTGVPAEGTNALIGASSGTVTNVNYNLPMAATTFGALTLQGNLSINASGFNCTTMNLNRTAGSRLTFNAGGVAATTGNLAVISNSVMTVTNGSTLTVGGTLQLGTSGTLGIVTNFGGVISARTTTINNANASFTSLFVIMGGTNNLGGVVINRSGPSSQPALGADGLVIYNGEVNITNLTVGSTVANSFLSMFIANGAVTNTGPMIVHLGATTARPARFIQTGGWFVDTAPNIVTLSPSNATAVVTVYSVTGGTNMVGGFQFGDLGGYAGTVNFTNASTMYIDSEGINSNGAVTINAALNGGGLLGATAPWTSTAPLKLGLGSFTFQTADPNGNPNNITLANVLSGGGNLIKTAGGTLAFDATNTYAGITAINAGTLAIGAAGGLTSPFIFVNSGAIYDVSQNSGYSVNPGQALAGFGSVNGVVNVSSNGIVFPGSNSLTGTLTLNGQLVETGGAINEFQLSGNPSGPNNDFLNLPGGLNASGVNSILINGGVQPGSIYPIISYGPGGFSGSLANLSINVNGASGTLSNSATAQTIYFIAQAGVRGPTNITWVGSIANNNWDVETSLNWVDTGSATKDFFLPGDNVLFGNLEATNVINFPGSVSPSAITVSTTTNYTFAGSGSINGVGGITVSNGTLNVLTTNNYTGPTVLDGGVLSTPLITASATPSGIGAASASEINLVFNGGTLAYTGPSASTDHGITLTNGGGTIDVTNGTALTLTGDITGNGTLTVRDSGNVILASPSTTYTNSTTIAGTMLQINNANGTGSGPINFSNAALVYFPSGGIMLPNAFNFPTGTTNLIVVTSGSGGVNPTDNGNWTGGGDVVISNSFIYSLNGNLDGMTGTIHLGAPGTTPVRFNSGGGNSCFGSTNATFDLGTNFAQLTDRNGGVMNLGGLAGSSNTVIIAQDAGSGTTTWSIGGNGRNSVFGGAIENDSSAANRISAVAKVGTGTLTLVGGTVTILLGIIDETFETNLLDYTGPTTISNGVLSIVVPDALVNSTNVTIASPSAVLDASQMGFVDPNTGDLVTNSVFEVTTNQTLAGVGTIYGFLVTDPTSIFNVGLPGSIGTMTVTNAVTLGGNIRLKVSHGGTPSSDKLVSLSSITAGGNLIVTNIGGTLQGNDTFTLFSATSITGTFSSITLPTLAGSQSWDTSKLYINGTIKVVGSAAPLSFSSITTSGNNIILNATGGTPLGPVSVLSTTNLLSPWSTLTTGSFDGSGNFTYTVTGALISGLSQQFYTLKVGP